SYYEDYTPLTEAYQWYEKGSSPLTTAVIEITSESEKMPWLGYYGRQSLERENKEILWESERIKSRLKAAGLLYELAAIEKAKTSTRDKDLQEKLAQRETKLVDELKTQLQFNTHDTLRIRNLDKFMDKQKLVGVNIDRANIAEQFTHFILRYPRLRSIANEIEKSKIMVQNLLGDFNLKARVFAGMKVGKDEQGMDIKDIVGGITFETPDLNKIADKIRHDIFRQDISREENERVLTQVSLELSRRLTNISGYGERLTLSAIRFYKQQQDYQAKLYRGDTEEIMASQEKMTEALTRYLDDLYEFYSNFEQLKIMLERVGVDTDKFFGAQKETQAEQTPQLRRREIPKMSPEFERELQAALKEAQAQEEYRQKIWASVAGKIPAQHRYIIKGLQDKVEAWRTAYNQLAEDIIKKGVNESELKRLVKAKLFPVYTEAAKVIRDRRLPPQVQQEIAGIVGIKDLFGYQALSEELKDKEYRRKDAVDITADIFTDRVVKNILDNYDNFLRQKGSQILNTAAKMREFMEVVDSLKFRLQSQSAYEVHKDKLDKDRINVLTAQRISEWENSFNKQKKRELQPEDVFRLLREKKIDTPPALFTDYQRWLLGITQREILQQAFKTRKKEVAVIRIQASAPQTHRMEYQTFISVAEFKKAYPREKRHYYAFALPHENMDDLGRGRKLTEEEVGMMVKEGKQRFQFWVEDAAGVEWLVVFNPADLEEQKAKKAAYKDSEEKLATVLAQAEYAVEMRVDEFGNPIDEPVGRYTAAQILEKKKIEGKKQTPVLDDAGIPVVVLSYKDEQGKTVERRISFWKEVEQEDGTIKLERVDAGKYGYDHIIADDTVTKNDPLHTGNRILFGENSVRYDLAATVMGEEIARSQIKSAEKSKEAMRKWKFVSKIFPVLGPVANEQVEDALRVLFNMAVSIQALPEVPTKEETQKFFEEKFGKRVIDALAIPKDLRPAAEKILEENKGDIAAITAKLNELTGLKLAEKQVQEAIENDGGERFFAFVQKALEEKDKGTLEEFLKQELRSERNIAMIKLVVYFVNDFAGAFNLKRDNNGLLNDFFAYFSGGEINLMTILGDAIDKKYLGRGEYMAKDTGRIFTGMGVTLDVFQLLKIDSTSDLYNPDILRFYVFGYPISLFGDEEAKVSKYIEARQKMFATEVSPDKNMITAVYEREEDLDKIKLKHVANIEIEKAGVKWPVYVNEETGGIILFGLPAYEKDFAKLEIKLERQQSIQKIKAGESGVIETISREAAPIMPERIIEKEQVGINDITDFILNFTNPNTLLNPSFYYKPGEKSIAYNRNLAYTYDEALAYFLLNMAGERELANAKAGFLSDTKGIYVFSHDTEKKHGELLGVANAINSVSRQGRILEDFPTSGPLAYLARLFLEEYNNTNDSRFLDAAIKLAEALEKRIADDGGVRKGVKRDVVRQGEEDHVKIQSGEENIVASRLFSELGELYQKDPEKYKQVEKFADLHMRVVNWKFAKLYDREKEYFVRGAFAGKKDNVFAADVNVQAILNEGPQAIDSRLGSGTAARLWQNTKDQARVEKLNVQRADGKEVNIAFMYDITNQAERDKLKQSGEVRPEAGFLEISAQMAVGHLVMADYYIKNGDIHAAGREIDEYKSLISNLDKLAVNVLGQGTVYPYATQANIRPFTGYPAKTPQAAIGSTAATTWMGFAKAGYNIFTKSYISAKLQNLAGISAPKRVMQFTPFERQIAKHNDAILRDKTNGENITVQAGERVKSAAEDKLDDLVYKQARLTQLREKGFAGLSEREKMELPQLLSGDYLVYFDEERSRYGYYDAWHQQLVEVTLNSSHKRIAQDIKRLELEVKFAAQELKLMDEGGVVLLNPDGTLRENGVLVGGQYLQEKLKQIRQMPLEQQYEISRRGWVYYAAQEGEEVIVWLRFPVKEKNEMRYADPLSGQDTLYLYEHGNLARVITKAKIIEPEYNEYGVETSSNIYSNPPQKIEAEVDKGEKMGMATTTAYKIIDEGMVVIGKVIRDVLFNTTRYEAYHKYPLPVMTINERYVIKTEYDYNGREKTSISYENTGTIDNPRYNEASPAIISKTLELNAKYNWSVKLVTDMQRDKSFIEVRDEQGRLIRKYDGRMEKDSDNNKNLLEIAVSEGKAFTVDARDIEKKQHFVVEKEATHYYEYQDRFATDFNMSKAQYADVMHQLGLQGIAMVRETSLYEVDSRTGKGRRVGDVPVARSVVKIQRPGETGIRKYFDVNGNILVETNNPKQKTISQQLMDGHGRKIIDFAGYIDLDGKQFVPEVASYSFYSRQQLKQFSKQYPELYKKLYSELNSLNIDIESEEILRQLDYQGKREIAFIGASFAFDAKTHKPVKLVACSNAELGADNLVIRQDGDVLLLNKNVIKDEITQQVIDAEGRIKTKYSGRFDKTSGQFVKEKETVFYYTLSDRFVEQHRIEQTAQKNMSMLGLYGIALMGETFIYSDADKQRGQLVAYSSLKPFADGSYVDNSGNILVQLTSADQHVTHQDIIDNRGRAIIRYAGKLDLVSHEFERAQLTHFFYNSNQLEEFKRHNPKLYEQLAAEYKKVNLDINNANFREVLNQVGRADVGFLGATYIYGKEEPVLMSIAHLKAQSPGVYIDEQGDILVEMKNIINNLYWQEQIDNAGRIRIKYDGVFKTGRFEQNKKTFYFYDYESFDAFRKAHPELQAELAAWQSKLGKLKNINAPQIFDELGKRGIAMVGFTYSYDQSTKTITEPLAFSFLNNVEGDGAKAEHYFVPESNQAGNISVQIVKLKQKHSWEEIRDNFGRTVNLYTWDYVRGKDGRSIEFKRSKVTDYYYDYQDRFAKFGIGRDEMDKMGKSAIALVGETYLLDLQNNTRNDKLLSRSIMQKLDRAKQGFRQYFNEKGEILVQLEDLWTKVIWQEVKDAHGRILFQYDGELDQATGIFKRDKVTRLFYDYSDELFKIVAEKMGAEWVRLGVSEAEKKKEIEQAMQRLGKFDIAVIGSTYYYDNTREETYGVNLSKLLAFSILEKFDVNEYEQVGDIKASETDYINDAGYVKALIYDVNRHLLWTAIKDNKGRIRYKYSGFENSAGTDKT
ncbi:MAG: hypothetical protein KKB82_01060, partial [Candidatus Omnitrophica bacterium]|nr:hypothetical protein [Candidatus Omnitrophota bacterium]